MKPKKKKQPSRGKRMLRVLTSKTVLGGAILAAAKLFANPADPAAIAEAIGIVGVVVGGRDAYEKANPADESE